MNIKELRDYQGEDRIISSYEYEIQERTAVQSITIRSGLTLIDRALNGGFQTGELYALSGPTKHGKTLMAQTLTNNFFFQQQFACWFSYEVHPRQFIRCFPELPLFYMPKKLKSADMRWLDDRILESLVKYHTRVVFIDHLHFLFDLFKTRNPSLEIGSVIRKLKTLAVDNDLIIFLLCHTSKAGADNVTYQSIRDSSFVAQEADSVFMILRTPKEGASTAMLRIEFHRRTGVMEAKIPLEKVGAYLVERNQP